MVTSTHLRCMIHLADFSFSTGRMISSMSRRQLGNLKLMLEKNATKARKPKVEEVAKDQSKLEGEERQQGLERENPLNKQRVEEEGNLAKADKAKVNANMGYQKVNANMGYQKVYPPIICLQAYLFWGHQLDVVVVLGNNSLYMTLIL